MIFREWKSKRRITPKALNYRTFGAAHVMDRMKHQHKIPHSQNAPTAYLDVLSVAQTMGLFAETVKVDIGGVIIIVMVISWTFSKIKT